MNILVVDDDPVQRFIAQKQLKILGLESQGACNGKEALTLAGEQKFDLILMDIHMPVMDGLEATSRIRALERESKASPVPIVALTANPNKIQCFEVGMTDYLFKPVLISELKRVVLRWKPTKTKEPHQG